MVKTAGLGTRLMPFTGDLPKPLLPVLGVPVLDYIYEGIRGSSAARTVMNIHHHAALLKKEAYRLGMEISDEESRLLGSAGGIRKALGRLGPDSFVVLNGDVITDVDLDALVKRHAELRKAHGIEITLAVLEEPPGGGAYREVMCTPEGRVTGLGEVRRGKPFFTGVAACEPGIFRGLREGEPSDFVEEVLRPGIRDGKVGCFFTGALWFDIGDPRSWLDTHFEIMNRMEAGTLPAGWMRLVSGLKRHGDGIWTKGSADPAPGWVAPAFWSGPGEPPGSLGPRQVLYGDSAAPGEGPGIGLGSHWVGV